MLFVVCCTIGVCILCAPLPVPVIYFYWIFDGVREYLHILVCAFRRHLEHIYDHNYDIKRSDRNWKVEEVVSQKAFLLSPEWPWLASWLLKRFGILSAEFSIWLFFMNRKEVFAYLVLFFCNKYAFFSLLFRLDQLYKLFHAFQPYQT